MFTPSRSGVRASHRAPNFKKDSGKPGSFFFAHCELWFFGFFLSLVCLMEVTLLFDPWYKTSLSACLLGHSLDFDIPYDVFSTQRIDEGTELLLNSLPLAEFPKRILDMGCGYGALGIPLAAALGSSVEMELVDRDLLAVQYSARNAVKNKLAHVRAYGSLGYRDLPQGNDGYDWILCNVPARIGLPFIQHLLFEGQARLRSGGSIFLVIIHDLLPLIEREAGITRLGLEVLTRGSRHTVLKLAKTKEDLSGAIAYSSDIYLRDSVTLDDSAFDRPFDLGGDDPKRVQFGLPLLLDALPRALEQNESPIAVTVRSGYGVIPCALAKRFNNLTVVTVERDLLALEFIERNFRKLFSDLKRLQQRKAAHFPDALSEFRKVDLIVGELSPASGRAVIESELTVSARQLRAAGGQGIFLCLDKTYQESVKPLIDQKKLSANRMMSRNGYSIVRLG